MAGKDSSASPMDRWLKPAVPRPDAGFTPPPRELAPGLWILDRRLRHFGLALLPSRTTLIRRADGGVLVVSPPPLVDRGALEAVGAVDSVLIPNPFHYLYAREFLELHPSARLWAVPGLGARIPELGGATELGPTPPDGWPDELDYAVVGSESGARELVPFHRPSGSVILTDLAFNMVRYPRWVDGLVWRASGIPARFGPGRTTRSLLLGDRSAAARGLSRIAKWPIRRIVLAHGEVVEKDAAADFLRAFAVELSVGSPS